MLPAGGTLVKRFWNEQAQRFKDSPEAGAPDVHYREVEVRAVLSVLSNPRRLLDVGCGNGYVARKINEAHPHCEILGIDSSPDMISEAKQHETERVRFCTGDVIDLSAAVGKRRFDHVLSCRCLINLRSWEEQRQAILQMENVL